MWSAGGPIPPLSGVYSWRVYVIADVRKAEGVEKPTSLSLNGWKREPDISISVFPLSSPQVAFSETGTGTFTLMRRKGEGGDDRDWWMEKATQNRKFLWYSYFFFSFLTHKSTWSEKISFYVADLPKGIGIYLFLFFYSAGQRWMGEKKKDVK